MTERAGAERRWNDIPLEARRTLVLLIVRPEHPATIAYDRHIYYVFLGYACIETERAGTFRLAIPESVRPSADAPLDSPAHVLFLRQNLAQYTAMPNFRGSAMHRALILQTAAQYGLMQWTKCIDDFERDLIELTLRTAGYATQRKQTSIVHFDAIGLPRRVYTDWIAVLDPKFDHCLPDLV